MKSNLPNSQFSSPKPHNNNPRIVIVHDWLTNMGGAELVVLAMHEAFPNAPIFTSTFTPENMPLFKDLDIRTTYLQNLPEPLRKFHKFFPILRVKAFQKLDLSEFDIILSSSSAEAKQVKKTRPNQIHICYCHTPIRYYWSHYKEYKKDPGFGKLNWIVKLVMPLMIPLLKKKDYKASQDVDVFISNSSETQKRVKKYYNKPSHIIHPPVDVNRFNPKTQRGDYFVALGRQVPYKRIDLAVKAFTKLNMPLKVFGNGSEHENIKKIAGPSIEFFTDRFGDASDKAVTNALNNAKGFIFPSEEDFGIVQVEALASGTPVIAFGKGGALDIIQDGESGVLFDYQTVDSIIDAIKRAEKIRFSPFLLRQKAKRFDKSLFTTKIKKVVSDSYLSKLETLNKR